MSGRNYIPRPRKKGGPYMSPDQPCCAALRPSSTIRGPEKWNIPMPTPTTSQIIAGGKSDGKQVFSRWWFETFFIFIPIWGRFPI